MTADQTAALPPPFCLVALDCVDSTNDEARRRVEQGAGHGLVIWARQQTSGRGRRGRAWVSTPGNLHCSFLLHPGSDPTKAPQLTFVAAVALAETLKELAPQAAIACKWPNDILCGGRKISGMLLETAHPWIILGVGVNVIHAPDPALYPTTCLRQIGSGAEAGDVLAAFADRLGHWHEVWLTQGFAPVRSAWLSHAMGVGGPVTVRLASNTVQEGRFAGLNGDGALLLEESDGTIRQILAGDVFFTA